MIMNKALFYDESCKSNMFSGSVDAAPHMKREMYPSQKEKISERDLTSASLSLSLHEFKCKECGPSVKFLISFYDLDISLIYFLPF